MANTSQRDEVLDRLLQTNATLMRMPVWPREDETSTPNSSPPDFDFNIECNNFKSSFARSLSINNASSHQSRSLDLERNDRNGAEDDEDEGACGPPLPRRRVINNDAPAAAVAENAVDAADNGIPPAIPARRPTVVVADVHDQRPQQTMQWGDDSFYRMRPVQERRLSGCMNASNVNMNNTNNNIHIINNNNSSKSHNHSHHKHCRRNIWPTVNGEQNNNLRDVTRLNGESRFMESLPTDCGSSSSGADTTRAKVTASSPLALIETTLMLQMRADTLQWQLKQAESGVNMYRVVSKEMANFLERFREYAKLRKLEKNREQLARSLGVHRGAAVGVDDRNRNVSNTSSYLRTRSSTNLHNLIESPSASAAAGAAARNATIAGTSASPSHTSFTDYTWRRCKKRTQPNNDDVEEQLNEEAFRLARTIENLLNTQQPDLTQHHNSDIYLDRSISSIAANSLSSGSMSPNITSPPSFSLNITTSANASRNGLDYDDAAGAVCGVTATAATATSASTTADPLTDEMLYLQNIRESRSSVRSSTDGSVHSTISSATSSSSKVETDEDPLALLPGTKSRPVCSSTEGESGFSSINSLQDVGIPLSSTMIGNDGSIVGISDYNFESDNSTLRAVQPSELSGAHDSAGATAATVEQLSSSASHPNNVVGLPLMLAPISDMHHRWDSSSKTIREPIMKHRFSTLSHDGVLWV